MSDFGGEQTGGGNPAAPAGWYPVDGGQQRYWDGAQWTDHTAPLPPEQGGPGAPAQPGFEGTAAATGMPAPGGYEPMPFGAPPGQAVGAVSSDDRTMALLAHILAIVLGFIGPLIIWLIRKDQSPFVDYHGKESLNFQITLFIGWIVAIVGALVLIGLLLMPVLLIAQIVMPIIAGVAANRGDMYRYPFTIRFLK